MYELTEVLSSWWGAAVVLGLILLNAIAIAGYWSKYQVDRRFMKLLGKERHSEKTLHESLRSVFSNENFDFFSHWANRLYFILTMGCALLLISLPLFPIDTGSRFFLWLALTASTLFGIYRLYLAWAGRDDRLRSEKRDVNSRQDFDLSLDRLSESQLPSKLLGREKWLKNLWRTMTLPESSRPPVTLIGFIIVGHSYLREQQGQLPADRVTVLVGDTIARDLRDGDLVCQYESDRFFTALIDCPAAHSASIGDRLTNQINQVVLDRAGKIYKAKLALVYMNLNIPASIRFSKGPDEQNQMERLWDALTREIYRQGALV